MEWCSHHISVEDLHEAAQRGKDSLRNVISEAQSKAQVKGDTRSFRAFQIFLKAVNDAHASGDLIKNGDNIIGGSRPRALDVAEDLIYEEKLYWGSSTKTMLAEFSKRCGQPGNCIVVDRVGLHLQACGDILDATPQSIKDAMVEQATGQIVSIAHRKKALP